MPVSRPVAVLLLLTAAAAAHAIGIPAGVPWGASMAEVLDARPGTVILRGPERLIVHARLEDLEVATTYRFDDHGLAAVSALSRARHHDRNGYIDDYGRLRQRLRARWGAPRVDDRAWRNDLFRDERGRWGDAVAAGHLVYYTEWRTGDTEVVMTLKSERLQVSHEIVYRRRAGGGEAARAAPARGAESMAASMPPRPSLNMTASVPP